MNNDKQTAEINEETETVEAEKPTLKLSREVVGVIAARTGIKAGMFKMTRRDDTGWCGS